MTGILACLDTNSDRQECLSYALSGALPRRIIRLD